MDVRGDPMPTDEAALLGEVAANWERSAVTATGYHGRLVNKEKLALAIMAREIAKLLKE